MNLPSTKTLERAFPGKGKELRRLLESPAAVRAHPAAVRADQFEIIKAREENYWAAAPWY